MLAASTDAVVARLEALRRAKGGGVVAFDADGTLWSGDVGDDFFRRLLAEGRIDPPAVSAIRALAAEFGVPVPGGAVDLAAALYDAYIAGRVPEDRVCEMVAFACAGWTPREVQEFSGRVVASGGLSSRLHRETLAVIEWARRERIEAFVVSASPRAVVEEGARPLGFDRDHIVAVTPLEAEGRVAAAVDRPIPYGEGKVTRLLERIGGRPLYGAFGDNIFDIPLLRRAELAVAVRPKPRLVERAGEVPGLVRME
jgi:phosphatidylglycerophosphatase C